MEDTCEACTIPMILADEVREEPSKSFCELRERGHKIGIDRYLTVPMQYQDANIGQSEGSRQQHFFDFHIVYRLRA